MELEIANICKRKNISLSKLAEEINMSKQQLHTLAMGGNATINTLSKIAKALDCTIGELVGEKPQVIIKEVERVEVKYILQCPKCGSLLKLVPADEL